MKDCDLNELEVSFCTSEEDNQVKRYPDIGEFILMVKGNILCYGNKTFILDKIKLMMNGDYPDFKDIKISNDDLVILKRIDIKIGIFLDE